TRLLRLGQSHLRRGELGDRDAEGRAAHVVQADAVAEHDAGWIAAVLAADADLEIGASPPAAFDAELHQLADAFLIDRLARIIRDDVVYAVEADERTIVVAAHTERRLSQVVRAEAEELGLLGDLIGRQRAPRNLDHRADEIIDRDLLLFEDLCRDAADNLFLVLELGLEASQRDHDLGLDVDALLLEVAGGFEDRPCLHRRDLGIDDSQAAAAEAEHRVLLFELF